MNLNSCLIESVDFCGYDRFLLCLTFESIVNYLAEIESAPEIEKCSGKILIDQLLVTGDGDNRFISCSFLNGKLDFSTAQVVTPDGRFRSITIDRLQKNYVYVEHSILTEYQRDCIRKGISF